MKKPVLLNKTRVFMNQFEQDVNISIISYILYQNFRTELFEILLFCSVKLVGMLQCVLSATFYVTIILRYTSNIYKICSCKPYRLKANFLTNTVV